MSEQQLRKALGAVNDLEPPRDDLFAERALNRGRARAHRRRSGLLGAAAAVVIAGSVGGIWVTGHQGQDAATSAGAVPEGVTMQSEKARSERTPTSAPPGAALRGGMPPARDLSGWFSGPMTPVRAAMETLAPTLEVRFPELFAGTYAADAANTHLVVCVTRPDAELEAMVRSNVPAGSDIEFRTVTHSIRQLRDAVATIDAARVGLQVKGVAVLGVKIDARTNRVVVTTMGKPHGVIESLVGPDLVTILVDTSHTPGRMLPGGSTLSPLQR
ncbi:MAG: alpha-lytic protease prodomain-containing protein [Intrasporangium sp.]|uniref:alpha-lytic protease prodomain-containing protein n=1 Tax=Intrasporangium sp. TaxID=1925024 RepID=UPI002648BC7D|nr:alpha-lytic protease prodomain-containing protein [Intrasporangium sp.]MDN5797368.1 alpha-lytic protease prodomain-containing protein [Intrasporangium sp.]